MELLAQPTNQPCMHLLIYNTDFDEKYLWNSIKWV